MNKLSEHIEGRRRDYQTNAETMRQELRALASFLSRIDPDRPMVANLDDCLAQELARHVEEVQTQARRMERTLKRYTETRAALGALLALEAAQNKAESAA